MFESLREGMICMTKKYRAEVKIIETTNLRRLSDEMIFFSSHYSVNLIQMSLISNKRMVSYFVGKNFSQSKDLWFVCVRSVLFASGVDVE